FTNNKSLYQVSDALLFHGADGSMNSPDVIPIEKRPARQLWAFQTMENPYVTRGPSILVDIKSFLDNLFNIMITYTRQADLRRCYGRVVQNYTDLQVNHDYFKGKTKMIAWVGSGCYKGRLDFLHNLARLVPIDLYGKCGNLTCSKSGACWLKLSRKYKFYLSLENFICRDYVTEKLYFNAYQHNMIPIVVGGANYSDPTVAPPGSYINVQDFTTMQQLADHIKRVGSNATLYNSYFKWKASYRTDLKSCDHSSSLCNLCRKL
ncbi:uncharacterized protein TRIADDRAFT_4004, partial [Trichoplax adhaerens]